MILTRSLIFLAILTNYVNGLNVLGIFSWKGESHFYVFEPYLHELANKGHNVTVISYFPQKEAFKNYRDIVLTGESPLGKFVPVERSLFTIFQLFMILVNQGVRDCEVLLANEEVRSLYNDKEKFDVVVVESFQSDCSLGLAYKLGAPVVGITSHGLLPWHYKRFGIPDNGAYVPLIFMGYGTNPTLIERIKSFSLEVYLKLLYRYKLKATDNVLAKYYDDVPPLEELGDEMKVMLLYYNFALTGSRLYPANVIEVNGFHVQKPKDLNEEFKKFVEESEHGVIYISFGTILKASTTPPERVLSIVQAISQLPQRVIWKWDGENLPGNANNILLSKWVPQNDLLAHPKVIAFFSHCGMLSTTEAIYHGVPMIGMPILGDQPSNAAAVEESGLGVQIQLSDLTAETLLEKFKIVLDAKFRDNVKLLSKAWHDRPVSPMNMAIFWTEYVARHKTIKFRSAAADVPLYQYLCLDVLFVFGGSLLTLVLIVKYVIQKKYFSDKTKID